MALFKSKETRRIERELKIRKGLNHIRKQVVSLQRNEEEYLAKARRAKQLGDENQYRFIRNAFKQTYSQRLTMERQLLTIETAVQIKNQAESHARFAEAINAVSMSINELFGATDLAKTQAKFEEAMMKAQTMEERMELFLDMSSDSMFLAVPAGAADIINDDDVDKLIEATSKDEEEQISRRIRDGIKDIEREIQK
jgi:hypothetical protein